MIWIDKLLIVCKRSATCWRQQFKSALISPFLFQVIQRVVVLPPFHLLNLRSFVEHLLGVLFEFTAAVHVTNLLCGGGGGTVWSGGTILRWALLSASVLLVNDHTLSTYGIFLGSRSETLITTSLGGSARSASLFSLHARLLPDDIEHRILQRLFVLAQTVLLPGVVKHAVVEIVSLHAAFKVVKALTVVGLLFKLERTAVLHILAELARMAATKLLQTRLNLLLLNVVVLLILRASRQSLPRQLAFD